MKFSIRVVFVGVTIAGILFLFAGKEVKTYRVLLGLRKNAVSVQGEDSLFFRLFPSRNRYVVRVHDDSTEDVVKQLAELKGIESLTLNRCNESIKQFLGELPNLAQLRIVDSDASCLKSLTLSKLSSLSLHGTRLGGSKLEGLEQVVDLRELSFSDSSIGDADLAVIPQIDRLELLDLSRTNVSDQGLEHLLGTNLKTLYLNETDISNNGLEVISKLVGLKELEIVSSGVTYSAILKLAEGPVSESLRRIVVFRDYYNKAGQSELGTRLPGCTVDAMMPSLPLDTLREFSSAGGQQDNPF